MQILALVAEYRERMEEQVVVLFQVLAAEINFGYKFQTVWVFPPPRAILISPHLLLKALPPAQHIVSPK